MGDGIRPFTINVSDDVLSDLQYRLKHTRWPDDIPGNDWRYGTQKAWLRKLLLYWEKEFNWRDQEELLNSVNHFKVNVSGIDLHFIHEKGKGDKPLPLLMSHGWPGSIYEFYEILPMLTDPESHGGSADDAFTVIAPSLPGYNFSFCPNQRRFSAKQIADTFVVLMQEILGYEKFAAQGGDWGAFITTLIAYHYPSLLHGIHLNLLPVRRDPEWLKSHPSQDIQNYEKQLKQFLKEETGYQWIQGTRPQTLSYALNDSPAGLAAWLVEKFFFWSDCNGDLDSLFGKDKLLTNIMLYWITGSIGSSFWPYYARYHQKEWIIPDGEVVTVPTGYIEFPKEILRPPRLVAEGMFANLNRWTVASKGGHFAAMEQPNILAREIRDFFRDFR